MHQEGPHMQMPRQPNNRMFRTMSVPHMAMGPGQQQQPMYGDYNGQVEEYTVLHWVACCCGLLSEQKAFVLSRRQS